jgi:hypothetical protein
MPSFSKTEVPLPPFTVQLADLGKQLVTTILNEEYFQKLKDANMEPVQQKPRRLGSL